MKKLLIILLCTIMLISNCACKQKSEGVSNIELDDDVVYDVETSQGDGSDTASSAGGEATDIKNPSVDKKITTEENSDTTSNSDTTQTPGSKESKNANANSKSSQISSSDNAKNVEKATPADNNSSQTEITAANEKSGTTANSPSQQEAADDFTIDESALFADTRTIVACWGDSVTEGMGMPASSYPTRLQEFLGDNYNVLNGGDGGENNRAIAARQGALKVYLKNKVKFSRGVNTVYIGDEREEILITKDKKPINLTNALGNQISVNNVTINGRKYKLRFEKFVWEPRSFAMYMDRIEGIDENLEIPANSEVIFNNSDITKKGGIDIYLIGANGGFEDLNDYISQIKSMIAYHGSDKYLVVIPYWTTGYDEIFIKNFGNHAVNFREAAIKDGLAYENITPTESDKTSIGNRLVPASLHYENNAKDVHLNQNGYHFLAYTLYEQGKKLGYFK